MSVCGSDHMTIEKSFSVLLAPSLVFSGCVAEFSKRLQGASFTKVRIQLGLIASRRQTAGMVTTKRKRQKTGAGKSELTANKQLNALS